MWKTVYGALLGSLAAAVVFLAFAAIDVWRGPLPSSPPWPARRAALAICVSVGLLAGALRDVVKSGQIGKTSRLAIAVALGAVLGLLAARAVNWPSGGDASLLYMVGGVFCGAVLLKAAERRQIRARRAEAANRILARRSQFSMRGLLTATLLLSVAMALLTSGPIRRWRLCSKLAWRGVQFRYDDSTTSFWRFLLGERTRPFFDRIDSAELPQSAGDEELAWLASRGGAKRLELGSSQVTDVGLAELTHFDRLTSLRVHNSKITDAGLQHVGGLAQLELLDLTGTAVTDRGVAEISKLPRLDCLFLSSVKIDDNAMPSIAAHSGLSALDLSYTNITDAGLIQLQRLGNLRTLYLRGTAVTDAGLKHLRPLEQLQWLDLERTQVTPAGLRSLRALPKLDYLSLKNVTLGDAASERLAGLPKLECLVLDGTKVSDAGLCKLQEMTTLRTLYVRRTRVTKGGAKSLESAWEHAQQRIAGDSAEGAAPTKLTVVR